ncbi:MAG: hypothetical protein R3F62_19770 [Planctomycetota bacterium]
MTGFDTLAHGSKPRLDAQHVLLDSPEAVRDALGFLPPAAQRVSAERPAVLVCLGPDALFRVQVGVVRYRGSTAIVEYVVRRNHEFAPPLPPRSPLHLVQLERPVQRLRFLRYSEVEVVGQLIQGADGRVRLLELPELGQLEDACYSYRRRTWMRRGAFRAAVADAWTHEGSHRVPLALELQQSKPPETVLQLLGEEAQAALAEHAGAAVVVRGLVQDATRRMVPWTVAPAFFEDREPLYADRRRELIAAA